MLKNKKVFFIFKHKKIIIFYSHNALVKYFKKAIQILKHKRLKMLDIFL